MWDYFFPLLFPKDSESLKILDIRLQEVGAKKTFKRYLKSEHTEKQTDRQTDISTYRKHQNRGPMLWKYNRATLSVLIICQVTFHVYKLFKHTKFKFQQELVAYKCVLLKTNRVCLI